MVYTTCQWHTISHKQIVSHKTIIINWKNGKSEKWRTKRFEDLGSVIEKMAYAGMHWSIIRSILNIKYWTLNILNDTLTLISSWNLGLWLKVLLNDNRFWIDLLSNKIFYQKYFQSSMVEINKCKRFHYTHCTLYTVHLLHFPHDIIDDDMFCVSHRLRWRRMISLCVYLKQLLYLFCCDGSIF